MQILHHQDEGLLLCRVENQVPQQRKGPGVPRLWAESRQVLRGHREVQELEQQGNVILHGHATGVQPLLGG